VNNWSNMKKAACGAATLIAMLATLLGFTWAMDRHWTPREIHDLFAQSTVEQFKQISKQNAIHDAQRDVQYWLKMEMFWRVQCQKLPHAGNQAQLQEAIKQRQLAEERQRKLQGK